MAAWFEALFDDRYLKFYPELFDLDVAERDAAFADRALSLPSGASLLDLGCGFGRHAVALAKLGYCVSGVDALTPMLNAARRLAAERDVKVDWVQRDMRSLSGLVRSTHMLIYCIRVLRRTNERIGVAFHTRSARTEGAVAD